MKLKKVVSALLVGTMLLSCVACGNNSNADADNKSNSGNDATNTESNDGADASDATGDGKLVVWTLAKDLETFADKYMEMP